MQKFGNTEKKAADMLTPIIDENNFELVDVEFVKEGHNWYLRVYIDKEGGITIDDCELVSKRLAEKLDETDPIPQAYILEVSSPGVERPLKREEDFVKFKGSLVSIKLYKPLDGKKEYIGRLEGLQDGVVTVCDEENNVIAIHRKDIGAIRLYVAF